MNILVPFTGLENEANCNNNDNDENNITAGNKYITGAEMNEKYEQETRLSL